MIEEIKVLNDKFFKLFDELQDAYPSLTDDAYISMSKKLLEQYSLEYELLDLQHRAETEREIERLKVRRDILVPFRWRTKWLKKHRQNYAATLVDMEVDGEATEIFAQIEEASDQKHKELEEQAYGSTGEWEIVEEEAPAEFAESAGNAPESVETAENGKEVTEKELPSECKKRREKKKLREEGENECKGNTA